jgi:hypothetical protein
VALFPEFIDVLLLLVTLFSCAPPKLHNAVA